MNAVSSWGGEDVNGAMHGASFLRALVPLMREEPSRPCHLSKVSPLNSVTLAVKFQCWIQEGTCSSRSTLCVPNVLSNRTEAESHGLARSKSLSLTFEGGWRLLLVRFGTGWQPLEPSGIVGSNLPTPVGLLPLGRILDGMFLNEKWNTFSCKVELWIWGGQNPTNADSAYHFSSCIPLKPTL